MNAFSNRISMPPTIDVFSCMAKMCLRTLKSTLMQYFQGLCYCLGMFLALARKKPESMVVLDGQVIRSAVFLQKCLNFLCKLETLKMFVCNPGLTQQYFEKMQHAIKTIILYNAVNFCHD